MHKVRHPLFKFLASASSDFEGFLTVAPEREAHHSPRQCFRVSEAKAIKGTKNPHSTPRGARTTWTQSRHMPQLGFSGAPPTHCPQMLCCGKHASKHSRCVHVCMPHPSVLSERGWPLPPATSALMPLHPNLLLPCVLPSATFRKVALRSLGLMAYACAHGKQHESHHLCSSSVRAHPTCLPQAQDNEARNALSAAA